MLVADVEIIISLKERGETFVALKASYRFYGESVCGRCLSTLLGQPQIGVM
ncbi:hypothetical protein HanIR_Chr02g0072061 [Helianthus annuus]|nr:hypothetical protein HanIR_Chr02g0072061 [Helianthus annuus]